MSYTYTADRVSLYRGDGTATTSRQPEQFVDAQVDDDRVVGIGRQGPFELRWQPPGRGLHDARRELEDALGPLP